ncbi:MAG: MFS transporter [Erysipelotrichaceae bacterium]|nr:MFS transporter [Erysipelotrichaceae bacterium]
MEKKQSIWTKHFLMVFAMSLFSSTAAYMTYPLITKYAMTIKEDIALASTISGLMSLSGLIVCPFAGMITDSFNHKRIIQFSTVFYVIILLGHILATNIPLLIIMRLLVGFSFSVNGVTGTVFSTHFIPIEKMAEGMGYAALANILAQAIGPGLGLYLVELSGYHLTFAGAALCAFMALVMVTLLPYEGNQIKKEKRKLSFKDIYAFEYTDYSLIAALLSIGNAWVSTFLQLIGEERNIANIGLFFTVYSVAMVFFRPMMGTLHDKKGIYYVMIPAIICATLGTILIGVGKTLMIMLVASVFKAIGQGTGTPSLQTEVIKKMDPSRSGVAASTVLIGMHIGNAFGPMLGGQLVERIGYKDMFVYFSIVCAILCFVLMYYRYLLDKRKQ